MTEPDKPNEWLEMSMLLPGPLLVLYLVVRTVWEAVA